jgi:RNA polymerase sigma factor (sigma-70 family)
VFPTTIWTTIQRAADDDSDALDGFARRYRDPVLRYVRSRGLAGDDAEDLCQDVFVNVLRGGLLGKADRCRGRFRSLLLTVARNAVHDRFRKQGRTKEEDVEAVDELRVTPEDPAFDREWAWHLTERALERLRETGSPYYEVLRGQIDGETQDRQKLWIARKKLAQHLRREVAFTCATEEECEAELEYLSGFLRPGALAAWKDEELTGE